MKEGNEKLITEWTESPDCRRCGIRHLALFEHLSEDDLNRIHKPIVDLSYQQGATVYVQNEEGQFIYTIRSGLVKLELHSDNSNKKIVRLLKQGDVFGLEALLDEGYHHDAVILDACNICKIPVEVINKLQSQSHQLCQDLMKRWDRALMSADEWMLSLNSDHASYRVEQLIQYLHINSSNHPEFQLLSRADMASILGLTKETVSRVIADLMRDKKLIAFGDGVYELV